MAPVGGTVGDQKYLPPGQRQLLNEELESVDKEAEAAKQNGDKQHLLVQLEKGLHLRKKLYVEESAQVGSACRRLCEACNRTATEMIQKGNMKGAIELLKRAEQVSDRNDADRAITWNNLACFYRRTGKLRTAVQFLERALALEEHNGGADAAQTHLNLCATLSQLERHADARHHAQSALIRTYEALCPLMLAGKLHKAPAGPDEQREQVSVLCIAYYNLAVEHEYLKHFQAAARAHAEGLRWASGYLGADHQLVPILKDSLEAVKAKLPSSSSALRRSEDVAEGCLPDGDSSTKELEPTVERTDEERTAQQPSYQQPHPPHDALPSQQQHQQQQQQKQLRSLQMGHDGQQTQDVPHKPTWSQSPQSSPHGAHSPSRRSEPQFSSPATGSQSPASTQVGSNDPNSFKEARRKGGRGEASRLGTGSVGPHDGFSDAGEGRSAGGLTSHGVAGQSSVIPTEGDAGAKGFGHGTLNAGTRSRDPQDFLSPSASPVSGGGASSVDGAGLGGNGAMGSLRDPSFKVGATAGDTAFSNEGRRRGGRGETSRFETGFGEAGVDGSSAFKPSGDVGGFGGGGSGTGSLGLDDGDAMGGSDAFSFKAGRKRR